MRCPQCAERNSVAARKCEFCGNKFKKKPLPLGLKLTAGGLAVAVTASIAASYVVPGLVDPEQNLNRAAKQLAAGPKSVEHAKQIKQGFATALKEYLKNNGDNKTNELAKGLQKLLPSSAFECHVVDLPRGLRVVEVDTVLQATSYLVMKTSSGTKVFDLAGFEVFDDARILNDSAGPVLALVGHTGGPPPHKPIVRTYALLPDYIHDETEKLVPPLKADGVARFGPNGHDILIELNMPGKIARSGKSTERVAYGLLKWKDARYSADFGKVAATVVAKQTQQVKEAAARTIAAATSNVTTAPNVVPTTQIPHPAPNVVPTPTVAQAPGEKIVVRSFTAADAARSQSALREAAQAVRSSNSVIAAVPMAANIINQTKSSVEAIKSSAPVPQATKPAPVVAQVAKSSISRTQTSTDSAKTSKGEVICSGATLREKPGRQSRSLNNFGRGTSVTVLGKEQDWYHVRVDGQEGYIYKDLLSVSSNASGGTSTRHIASSSKRSLTASASGPQPAQGSRRRSRRSDDRLLIAEASPRKHQRVSRRTTVAEPILVP